MRMNKTHSQRKWLMAVVLSLFTLTSALAQRTVSGTVTDENGEGLPGVSVVIAGTSTGTATNLDGKYQLNLPETAQSLVFSFIGYQSKTVEIGSQTVIDVQMDLDLEQLEEVVVIGYGVQKKEDMTGAVAVVSAKDFNKGNMVNPEDLLAGRTPGVQITSSGGAPGSGAQIRIRGGSSLSALNDPLIIVDGVQLDGNGINGLRNPLSAINPNDIETMNVLKDASATAIYGSRASNGVIIITTKKGKKGAPMKVNLSSQLSVFTVPKTVDVLSASQFEELVTARSIATGDRTPPEAASLLGYGGQNSNTDWQGQIFDTAIGTDNNLSVSGAYKNLPYRASVGYTDQDGILKTSNFQRTTLSLGLNPTLLNDNLKVDFNIKGAFVKNQFPNEGAIGSAVRFDPTKPIRTGGENDLFGGYYYWAQPTINSDGINAPIGIAPANPVALLNQRDNSSNVNRIITNLRLTYDLPFAKGLSTTLEFGTDRAHGEGEDITPQAAASSYQAPFNGIPNGTTLQFDDNGNPIYLPVPFGQRGGGRTVYEQDKTYDYLNFRLNYSKDFPDFLNSRINLLAGYEWQYTKSEGFSRSNNLFGTNTLEDATADIFATEYYLVSFFGRAEYSINDKYLFTFTLRNDGTSRFLDDNRWGLFPSAAFAWRISDEAFIQDIDAISQLKLRLGWGITGQQNIGLGDYPALARYTTSLPTATYQFGNEFVPLSRLEGYNSSLKWEETTTTNIGLDFGLFGDRIAGSIDYYFRETTDLLNSITPPAGTNFTNFILQNVGSLENKGIELALSGWVIDTDNFKWNAGFNISRNVNEITSLTLTNDPNYIGVLTGGISGGVGSNIQIHSVGYPSNSFYVLQQIYDQNGKPIEGAYVDQPGEGDDRIQMGNPVPNYYMGFSSRINYRNFDFSFNARWNVGNEVYNNVASNNGTFQELYNPNNYLNNLSTDILNTRFENAQYFSSYYVQDASFFRMDNITLGYDFGKLLQEKVGVYVNFTVQNAFVITDYDGLDPEVVNGIDNNIFPRPRTYVFGVNVNF